MAIQLRRGDYEDFDKSKMQEGEMAVVTSNDPNTESGRATYVSYASGDESEVKRLVHEEDYKADFKNLSAEIERNVNNLFTDLELDEAIVRKAFDDLNINGENLYKEIEVIGPKLAGQLLVPVVFGTNIHHPVNPVDIVYSGIITIPGIDRYEIELSQYIYYYENGANSLSYLQQTSHIYKTLYVNGMQLPLPPNSFYVGASPELAGKQCFLTLNIIEPDTIKETIELGALNYSDYIKCGNSFEIISISPHPTDSTIICYLYDESKTQILSINNPEIPVVIDTTLASYVRLFYAYKAEETTEVVYRTY